MSKYGSATSLPVDSCELFNFINQFTAHADDMAIKF